MKFFSRTKKYIASHKIASTIIILIVIVGGYYTYKKVFAAKTVTQYVISTAQKGKITQTVTGSGQVSAENQLDVASEVSAKVTSIKVSVGQTVKTGDIIATLDAHDAMIDLENARISYSKLVEPAKTGDIANAENNLAKAYSDGFGAVSDTFLDIPSAMSGLKDMLYGRNGYLSDGQTQNFTETGREYRKVAGVSYDRANGLYTSILSEYKTLDKNSPREKIESIISKTYDFTKEVSQAIRDTQNAVTFVSVSQPDYSPTGASTAASSINTWLGQINSDLSSLLSAKNTIESSADTLQKLRDGADALDIQAEKLSLSQKQRTYEKYFIRAPFDGVIGKIPVKIYDQASNGTTIATLVSNQKITTIPLNEVDAVKVKKGDKVDLTFDAIEKLIVKGTVTDVDLVGTQSQGVVTYNIKIAFDATDERILPGMSVDAVITTEEKTDIIVVPVGAVKGKGKASYVETFDTDDMKKAVTKGKMTILTLNTPPQQIGVVVGDSDDTNIEIVEGISEGQSIVVKTTTSAASTVSTTPTIFSSLGGNQRNVIQNANRTTGGRTTTGTAR